MIVALCRHKFGLNLGSNGSHKCAPNPQLLTKLEARLLRMGSPQLATSNHVAVLGQVLPCLCIMERETSFRLTDQHFNTQI